MNDRISLPALRRLAANSGWNCAGQAIPMLAALATAPQLVQLLGVERFGLMGIIWAVLGYLGIFELGIGRALTQAISRCLDKSQAEEVWVGLFALASMGSIASFLVGGFAYWFGDRAFHLPPPLAIEVRNAFFGVAAAMPFVLVSTGLRGILEAYGHFRALSLVRSTAGSLMFLGPWAVCLVRPSLTSVVGVLVLTRAATFAVLLWMCAGQTRELRGAPRWSAATLRRLLAFGGWVTVSQLVGAFWGFADRMLLGLLATPSVVAYYVTPNEVISRCGIVSSSLVTAAFPDFARASEAPGRAAELFQSAIRWLFWLICPLCLLMAATGPELMHLWLGPVFSREATPLLPWLIAYLLINSFATLPVAFLQAHGQPRTFARFQLAELPVVLAFLAAGIIYFGALGAAVVMFLRLAVEVVFLTASVSGLIRAVAPKARGFLGLFGAASAGVLMISGFAGVHERLLAATVIFPLLIFGSEWMFRRPESPSPPECDSTRALEKLDDQRAVHTATPWNADSPDEADSAAASRVCVE